MRSDREAVFVESAARLHFGILDLRGSSGRWFGGLGAAAPAPLLLVSAEPSETLCAEGEDAERAAAFAARYLAHYLWRKHGETAAAERWLVEVEKLKGENSIVDDAAAKSRELLPLERDYQKKALESYRAAYEAGSLDRKDAPGVAYLLGELSRRQGDAKGALPWFQKCLETTDSDPLKKLAAAQKSLAEK